MNRCLVSFFPTLAASFLNFRAFKIWLPFPFEIFPVRRPFSRQFKKGDKSEEKRSSKLQVFENREKRRKIVENPDIQVIYNLYNNCRII